MVKKYGGKVTGAPSSKTSFVVLGENAGPKKIATIKKYNLKAINEDGLFQLIETLPANGGSGKQAVAAKEKRDAEEKKIKEMVQEMSAQQDPPKVTKASTKQKGKSIEEPVSKVADESQRLWTDKYAPQRLKDVCGNQGLVEKLQKWLHNWQTYYKAGFRKPGPEGLGLYRGVIISGPPGIGKTTAAHLVARLENYDKLEFNASDTRSEKLIRESLSGVTNNKSLVGFLTGKTETNPIEGSVGDRKRLVLIMDEVDGMSSGDRGGVGAMTALIRKTKVSVSSIFNLDSNYMYLQRQTQP